MVVYLYFHYHHPLRFSLEELRSVGADIVDHPQVAYAELLVGGC